MFQLLSLFFPKGIEYEQWSGRVINEIHYKLATGFYQRLKKRKRGHDIGRYGYDGIPLTDDICNIIN